jgi:hypothetical protein
MAGPVNKVTPYIASLKGSKAQRTQQAGKTLTERAGSIGAYHALQNRLKSAVKVTPRATPRPVPTPTPSKRVDVIGNLQRLFGGGLGG